MDADEDKAASLKRNAGWAGLKVEAFTRPASFRQCLQALSYCVWSKARKLGFCHHVLLHAICFAAIF